MPLSASSGHYKNPDNDPRGPYHLVDLTTPFERTSHTYGWHGKPPPAGRSWRISKEKAEALEKDGRIVVSPSGLPRLKRYLAEARDELRRLLVEVPSATFDREVDLIQNVAPRLVKVLGYDEDETFYQYGNRGLYADVVLSASIEARPWVVLEVNGHKARSYADQVYQLRRYLEKFDCNKGLMISPELLILVTDGRVERFELNKLNLEQSEYIFRTLDRDAQSISGSVPYHGRLLELIESVEKAGTNQTKGKSLEALVHFLFQGVSALSCKYKDLQTRSSEIDLIIEYDRSNGYLPLFEELGRYSLIECKNWSKPVGVSPVRDFMGKLDKCKARLGVIFAKNGVTGVDAGADALREIQSRFDRDGVFLLVFSLEDIRDIKDGVAFVRALDRKADKLRFDSQ